MNKKISLFIIFLILLFLLIGSVSAESITSNYYNSDNLNQDSVSPQVNDSKYNIEDESFYNKTNLNEDIQSILDNADENSTIEFLGSKYTDLHLTINKSLNIMGSNVLISSSLNNPVFTLCSSASGTKISGFNIVSSGSSAIYLDNVSDVVLSDINIQSSGDGIDIMNSNNIDIIGNDVKSSKIGINLYNSEGINIIKNNISGINKTKGIDGIKLDGCKGIKSTIKFNNISYFNRGINSLDDVNNIVINSNRITYCDNGVFLNSGINMNVTNNTIENNYGDSLVLNGKSDNLLIKSNIFSKNGGGGFVIGDSYDFSSNKGLKLSANYFTKNKNFDIQSNGYDLYIDYNIANHICPRVNMKNYNLKAFNEGNKYGIGIYTVDGKLATDLPTFTTIINTNNGFQEVTFVNGKAQFDLDFSKDSYLELTYGTKVFRGSIDEILKDLANNKQIEKDSKDFFDSDISDNISSKEPQPNNLSESVNSTDLHESTNNGSSGNYYVSSYGSSSVGLNSLSSQGIASKSASSPSPLLTYVTVDEEIYKVAGVAGLVILIILVIGVYYSRDIYDMLKK